MLVLIDGQNLFKGVNRRFRTRLHPILLGRALAGERELVGVRYYSGIHDPDEDRDMYDLVVRRHDLMRRSGVAVTERTLRYHWEWRVQDRDIGKPWWDDAPERTAAPVRRHRGAREKGIDVALALDAVGAALSDECDVVVVVSRDRDLMEIAHEVRERCNGRALRVEVAFVSERRGDERALEGYDGHQEIDAAMVERCRDDFDYRRPLAAGDVEAFLRGLD